jgi:hypothetical protein
MLLMRRVRCLKTPQHHNHRDKGGNMRHNDPYRVLIDYEQD